MADRHEWKGRRFKKKCSVGKLKNSFTQYGEKHFLEFVLKEMMGTDLVWEMVKYMASLFLVDFVQFCIFVSLFEKKHSATVFRVGIIKNNMLSLYAQNEKKSELFFMNIYKVK